MDFYGLPDQTLIEISKVSPLTWFRICEMVPFMGEWTPCPSTQRLVKRPFIECIRAVSPWRHTVWWHLNGLYHRDGDLPTVEYADGSQHWFKLGRCHRDGDFPAVIWSDGGKEWWKHGQRHRDGDLPAATWSDGYNEWYTYGQRIHQHQPNLSE
jgi:hypothetical protein